MTERTTTFQNLKEIFFRNKAIVTNEAGQQALDAWIDAGKIYSWMKVDEENEESTFHRFQKFPDSYYFPVIFTKTYKERQSLKSKFGDDVMIVAIETKDGNSVADSEKIIERIDGEYNRYTRAHQRRTA